MADYGGMRPTFTYDPQLDPKLQRANQFRDALQVLAQFASSERDREEQKEARIFSADLQRITQKGLDVDAERYYADAGYRDEIRDKEADLTRVTQRAVAFSPEAGENLIAPVIQGFIDIFPDTSPEFIMDDDLAQMQRVLFVGDDEMNEPAITNLSSMEIEGIDGLEHELVNLGLWADGEEWDDVKGKLRERFDWFNLAFKEGNKQFVATQSEADAILAQRLQTTSGKLALVQNHMAVQNMENVDDKWINAQARLIITDQKEHPGEIWDDDSADWIDAEDYWAKYPTLNMLKNYSISELYNLQKEDPAAYQAMMGGLSKERMDVWTHVVGLVDTYKKGSELVQKVEEDIDFEYSMDVQTAAKLKLEDMEEVQVVLNPLAQRASYITAMLAGEIEIPGTTTKAALEKELINLKSNFVAYQANKAGEYQEGTFSLRADELDEIWSRSIERNLNYIITEPDEVVPEEREEYMEGVKDLDYDNIIQALDLI